MKLSRLTVVVLLFLIILSSCIYSNIVIPLDTNVDRTVLGAKEGRASSYSVLWLVAWGDASTAAAAKQGGIGTVNHMDREIQSILYGIYTKTTTVVYGD